MKGLTQWGSDKDTMLSLEKLLFTQLHAKKGDIFQNLRSNFDNYFQASAPITALLSLHGVFGGVWEIFYPLLMERGLKQGCFCLKSNQ